MSYDFDASHVYKVITRAELFSRAGKLSKVLLMPSKNCLDILAGMSMGKIDAGTEILAYEKDKKIAKIIREFGEKHGLNIIVREKLIENDVDFILQSNVCSPFDLVYLDFCGQMTYDVSEFLGKIKWILRGTLTAYTFSLNNERSSNCLWKDTWFEPNKTFKVKAKNSLVFEDSEKMNQQAIWSISKVFDSLGIKKLMRKIDYMLCYSEYKKSSPMVFFITSWR